MFFIKSTNRKPKIIEHISTKLNNIFIKYYRGVVRIFIGESDVKIYC